MKVSVIIPTYNRGAFLKRAVKSVLNQTFQDFELIIIDDGSTDNTKEVVNSFSDNRIKYIYQENSGGAARPKNTGIKIAQGEYIAILDSDDEWLPDKIKKQIDLFEKYSSSKLGIVGCNIFIINNGKKKKYRIPKYNNVFEQMLVTDNMGTGSAMVYKKEVFDRMGLFDENLRSGQDREMRIRLAQEYHFAFIDDYLINYYVGHNNISSAGLSIKKREKDWDYIFNKYKKYYERDKKLYSDKLRYDGTRYMLLNLPVKARKSFRQSIRKNPLNIKSFLYLFLSFFGVSFYNKLTEIKLYFKK